MRAELHQGELSQLRDAWSRLHAATPQATPFTSPEWADAWWAHFDDDARPVTIVVHDAGEVVGLAALALTRRGPLRLLTTVGVEPGDYWDVLAPPPHRDAVAAVVAAELARLRGRWDLALVKLLPPASPLPGALRDAGLHVIERAPIRSPAIALPETFEDYLAGLPKGHRQNLRRHLNRLDQGEVELRELREPAELPAALERWQTFRARQWDAARRGINPEHLTDRFRSFLLDVAGRLLPKGQALVWEFRREAQPIACYVNFADGESFYWYLGGFDPAAASLGVGKIAIGHGIRSSIAAGRARFDFTRGDEPYKYWYGAEDRLLPALVLGTGHARSRAALVAARLALARRA